MLQFKICADFRYISIENGLISHLFYHPQVIVMSATMDVDLFSQYFNKSPVLYLEGRQHHIQIYYTKQPQSDYLHAALVSIFQIHQVSQ